MKRNILKLKLLLLLFALLSTLCSYAQTYGYVGDYINLSKPSIPSGATDLGGSFITYASELYVSPTSGTVQILKYFSGTRTVRYDYSYVAEVDRTSLGQPIVKGFSDSFEFDIRCNPIYLLGIPSDLTLEVGQVYSISWSHSPSSKSKPQVGYESSDNTVARVSSSGRIEAVSDGYATITVTNNSGPKSQISVTVNDKNKIKLSAYPGGRTVNYGQKVYLTATADGNVLTDARIYYTLDGYSPSTYSTLYNSEEGITINDDCTIKAIAYKDGLKTSNVLTEKYKVMRQINMVSEQKMLPNSTYQLTPTIIPNSVANKGVTWTSSEPDLVSVNSSGLVSVGDIHFDMVATITCTVNDGSGYSASCNMEITNKEKTIEGKSLAFEIIDDSKKTCRVYYCQDSPKKITIPSEIFGCYTVSEISESAFHGLFYLTSVTIPNSVTSIGNNAFEDCKSLKSINIPCSVNSIGRNAFRYCNNVTSIVVDDGNDKYDSRENCNAIINKESNTLIVGCRNTIIPNSVTSIDDFSFWGCEDLASIAIPDGVISIGESSFYGCSSLDSIFIPKSVKFIGARAFQDCSKLTSISVESGNTNYDSRENCNAIIRTSDNILIHGCNNTMIPTGVTSINSYAFYGCDGLTSLTIPNSVTEIGTYAFYDCDGLTSVTIPNSVTEIGTYAFYDCDKLTEVRVESVTPIYIYKAFSHAEKATLYVPKDGKIAYENAWGWDEFKEIVAYWEGFIPFADATVRSLCNQNWDVDGDGGVTQEEAAMVTSLGSVFSRTDIVSFDELSYFTGLTSIDDNAFANCSNLASITIPSSVSSIGDNAFDNCSGLTSITIPNSVTSIGSWAFQECSGLTSITIPNSVTSIGISSFSGCSSLTSITIPNSVTEIGSWAFSGCSSLASITIPNSVTAIGWRAFDGCSKLFTVTVKGATPISITSDVFTNRTNTVLIVPEGSKEAYAAADYWKDFTITEGIVYQGVVINGICYNLIDDGFKATVIASATSEYSGDITIPESVKYESNSYQVTSIVNYAFANCSRLRSITIPNSVTSIGDGVFANCSGLRFITIPNSVSSMGYGAFYGCTNLTSITIPNTVTSIGENAFSGCISLTSIIIPNDVTEIGRWAFDGCTSLASVTLPESLTSIEYGAFDGCTSLTSITIPNCVSSIDNYAFAGCSALKSIAFHCKSINRCGLGESISEVVIGNEVETIGFHAFSGCTGITSIVIPHSVTSISYLAFEGCNNITSITVDSGNKVFDSRDNCNAIIKSSDNALIFGCQNTVIPNSVTEIHYGAFQGCVSLRSITIPKSVTSFSSSAFGGCDNLNMVKLENETPVSIYDDVFSNRKNATLYVPIGSKTLYEKSASWKDFEEIVELQEGDIFFADATVNSLCIKNWDYNGDGVLSQDEAAAVTDLGKVFSRSNIVSFDELNFFTGLTAISNDAFAYCRNLKSISIPSSITSIGNLAFYECSNLTSIIIPNSVTSIGDNAFSGCSNLTSITIPNNVTSIGDYAFSGCYLTSITVEADNAWYDSREGCNAIIRKSDNTLLLGCSNTVIPNSVTSIGDYAFSGCYLTSITLPNSVTSIGDAAFNGCWSLTSINIPNSLTSIGYAAFYDCSSLTSVTLPESLTSIASSTFYNCRGLTSIAIPNSVTSIGDYAFKDCNELNTIVIPNSVTSIGDGAFEGCWNLESINIPSNVNSIGRNAFCGCYISSIVVDDGNEIYDSRENCNAIINKESNTLIVGCRKTIIPNSVTSIDDYAFYDCGGLASFIIPDGVISIGDYAFEGCTSMTSITIPNSVTSIGNYAFAGCRNLISVSIPSSMTSIGDGIFANCSSMASITIPNSVTSIAKGAFSGCI